MHPPGSGRAGRGGEKVACFEATNTGSLCLYFVSKRVRRGERVTYTGENVYLW